MILQLLPFLASSFFSPPFFFLAAAAAAALIANRSNSKRGGMATHAGVALELGIVRPTTGGLKMMSPQMEAILIWCQCRVREYEVRT